MSDPTPLEYEATLLTRRQFVKRGLAGAAGLLLAACAGEPEAEPPATAEPPQNAGADSPTAAARLDPTPACGDDDDDPTPSQTEGPFYTPETPRRTNLVEAGMAGTPLLVTGRVLTPACRPIPNALLDFWQADDAGNYDNAGFRLRGHQFADDDGNFHLETIVPGLYPGRTRHIHVKVQPPNGQILTTQLYFQDEPANAQDGIFRPELLTHEVASADGRHVAFDFVLAA